VSLSFVGQHYHATEELAAAHDVAGCDRADIGMKRKSGEDSGVKKKWPKQLFVTDVENVYTAFQKLSGWLDECSSKQRELGQKLKVALGDDGNAMAAEDSVM
jgi:hypothetical protein